MRSHKFKKCQPLILVFTTTLQREVLTYLLTCERDRQIMGADFYCERSASVTDRPSDDVDSTHMTSDLTTTDLTPCH